MPVTVERKPLMEALRLLRGVVRKTTIPILEHVLLETDGEELHLSATDLDRRMRVTIPVNAAGDGLCLTVHAARLSAFVGALPDGAEVALIERPRTFRLEAAAGRSRQQIAAGQAADFPKFDAPEVTAAEVDAQLLRRLLVLPSTAVSIDETKFYLLGVHLVAEGDTLSAVATSGAIMLHLPVDLPESLRGCTALQDGIIVPSETAQILAGLLTGSTAEVAISDRTISVDAGNVRLQSRLVEGSYVRWRQVIPALDNGPVQHVGRLALMDAVKRIAISAEQIPGAKTGRAIAIRQDGEDLILTGRDSTSAGEERVPIRGEIPDDFGLDPGWLEKVLHLAEGDSLALHMTGPGAPIRIVDDGDPKVERIIMPVRVARAELEG